MVPKKGARAASLFSYQPIITGNTPQKENTRYSTLCEPVLPWPQLAATHVSGFPF